MDNTLTKDLQFKIKGLAYYQIAGGIIGIVPLIRWLAYIVTVTGMNILIFIFAIGLYSFSIYCGQQLLKGRMKNGLLLSTINQALQAINIAVSGFAFKFIAGLILSIGFDYTDNFKFTFDFSLSEFQLNINTHEELVTVGINIFAVYLIYFIGKLEFEIENTEKLFKAAAMLSLEEREKNQFNSPE